MAQLRFVNARSIRNAVERTRLHPVNRLVETAAVVGHEDLMTPTAADVRAQAGVRRGCAVAEGAEEFRAAPEAEIPRLRRAGDRPVP